MKKVRKIIILLGFLVLVVACYIAYDKWRESRAGLVSFENAMEQEVDGKKYIENKEVGLRFAIPDGWELTKGQEGVAMHTPDFVPLSESSFFIPQKGCWIEFFVSREGNSYDYNLLEEKIATNGYCDEGGEIYKCQIVNISGLNGIREDNFNNEGNIGSFVGLSIPFSGNIYQIYSYLFGEDKERCSQEFSNFLTTFTIKK